MNKRTLANLMSIEKKKFQQNVEKYRKLNAAKRLATKRSAAKNYGEDPISFKKAIEAEFKAASPEMISEDSTCSVDGDEKSGDVVRLLKAILDKQNQTFDRLANLEARMCSLENSIETFESWSMENTSSKPEEMAREKMLRQTKVLIEKVHKSILRFTGEEQDEPDIDITASLPITSHEAATEFEEKMLEPEYKAAVKLLLLRLKGCGNDFEKVFRQLYSDDFINLCNWEGKNGKYALIQFSLAADLLYDASSFPDRHTFDKAIRKCIEKSHHRMQQKTYHYKIKNQSCS